MALRGGKQTYSAKTLNGNFVEDRKNPRTLQRIGASITAPGYVSTTMAANMSVRKDNPITYGRGLVLPSKDFDSKLNYSNTIFYNPKSSTTTSVNKSTFGKPATEFSTVFKTKPTAMSNPATLAAYRQRWTRDTPGPLRNQRFETENTFVNDKAAGRAYGRDILRENPNLAKPLEALHELMVARSDVLMEDKKVKPPRSSVPAAKELQISLHALNRKKNGKVTRQDFVWGLSDSNIVLDKIGFEAVWKFLGGGIAPDAQIDIKLIVRQLSI